MEIRIDVVSDNICPWCYVAKKRMEQALAHFPHIKFTVEWVPYLLKLPPELKAHEGLPGCQVYREFLTHKFGEQSASNLISALIKAGEPLNIIWRHDRPVVSNTVPSHCLVQYCKTLGKQNEAIEAVLQAYFVQGLDISKEEVLLGIAVSLGLNPAKVKHVINDPSCHQAIIGMSEEIKHKNGITSVPTFLLTRTCRLKFSGAQTVETFVTAIKQMIDPTQPVHVGLTGDSCCPRPAGLQGPGHQ